MPSSSRRGAKRGRPQTDDTDHIRTTKRDDNDPFVDDGDDSDEVNPLKHMMMNGGGDDDDDLPAAAVEDDDEEEEETVEEKRLRMAHRILAETTKHTEADSAADAEQRAAIAHRLYEHVLEEKGTMQRSLAAELATRTLGAHSVRVYRGHRLTPTCVALSFDGATAVTGAKDATMIQWDVATGRRVHVYTAPHSKRGANKNGHAKEVLGVAISHSGHLMASGSRDKTVKLWDTRTHECVTTFTGHRSAVTAVSFRMQSEVELFSASLDRTVKIWNTEQKAYVDTLFGHQSDIMGMDALISNRAITCSADHTVRLWKVVEESQLVWRAQHATIDAVAMLNDECFASGSQDGSISLWTTKKKRPTATIANAHDGKWISALGVHRYSDVLLSGASDGFVRVWDCSRSRLTQIHRLPVVGTVNGICVAATGRFAVAAVGQEHRFGRWSRVPGSQNGLQVLSLVNDGGGDDGDGDDDGDGESV